MLGVQSMAHHFVPPFLYPEGAGPARQDAAGAEYGDRTAAPWLGGGSSPAPPSGAAQQQQQHMAPPYFPMHGAPPPFMPPGGLYSHPYLTMAGMAAPPIPTSALLGLPPSAAAAHAGGLILPPLPPHPAMGAAAVAAHAPAAYSSRSMACMACRHSKVRCTKERPRCKRCVRLHIDCVPQTRGSYTAAAAEASRLAMLHRPKKHGEHGQQHHSASGSRAASSSSCSSSPSSSPPPAHPRRLSPASSSSSLPSWEGAAAGAGSSSSAPLTSSIGAGADVQPICHPAQVLGAAVPAHASVYATPAAAGASMMYGGPTPAPAAAITGHHGRSPPTTTATATSKAEGGAGGKADVFLLSSLAAAALEQERTAAHAAALRAAATEATKGPLTFPVPNPQQQPPLPQEPPRPHQSSSPPPVRLSQEGFAAGERLSYLSDHERGAGGTRPPKRPRPEQAAAAAASDAAAHQDFESALQALLADCHTAGEAAAASAAAIGKGGGAGATAACAAIWTDGRLELSCNDTFSDRFLARADFQRALDAAGSRPEALWGRLLPPEWRAGLAEMYQGVWAAAARGPGGRAAMEQGVEVIDRRTGVPCPALLALHALVSPCGCFLAMVLLILPLRDSVGAGGGARPAVAASGSLR